jgi:hypothetical protein
LIPHGEPSTFVVPSGASGFGWKNQPVAILQTIDLATGLPLAVIDR